MVLTLLRQFVTLTGTGKAVRVFLFNVLYSVNTQLYISYSDIIYIYIYIHTHTHLSHVMATCFDRKRSSSGQ